MEKEIKIEEVLKKIKEKEAEVELLRDEYYNLTHVDEEIELRNKYYGKYFKHNKYSTWVTYLFVNHLCVESNKLRCTEFTIMKHENGEIYGVSSKSNYDFTCHYISPYSEEHDIDDCVEITKEEFVEEQNLFLENFHKSFELQS